jgi:hypothetical protein
LIVRHVPREISREGVLQAIADRKLVAELDFLYCPLDYVTKKGFGYVLLNFASLEAARRFRVAFHGAEASCLDSNAGSSPLEVVAVQGEHRQGLQASIDRYRNSPVMHNIVPDEFKPIVLSGGRRVAFPKPTQKLEAPNKLPRAVWKAWTGAKKRAFDEPESTRSSLKQAAAPLLGYWDQRNGMSFRLPVGFRSPPGLKQPEHLLVF